MARSFYHEHPDTLVVETEVADAQPGRVLLAQSPFYPGGGGQVADRGLVRAAGLPFREAHHVTGAAVRLAESRGLALDAVPLADLASIDPRIDARVYAALSVDASVERIVRLLHERGVFA